MDSSPGTLIGTRRAASSVLARQSSHSNFMSFSFMLDVGWDAKIVSFDSVKLTPADAEVITPLLRRVYGEYPSTSEFLL
jgi:hypothetical protein